MDYQVTLAEKNHTSFKIRKVTFRERLLTSGKYCVQQPSFLPWSADGVYVTICDLRLFLFSVCLFLFTCNFFWFYLRFPPVYPTQ